MPDMVFSLPFLLLPPAAACTSTNYSVVHAPTHTFAQSRIMRHILADESACHADALSGQLHATDHMFMGTDNAQCVSKIYLLVTMSIGSQTELQANHLLPPSMQTIVLPQRL